MAEGMKAKILLPILIIGVLIFWGFSNSSSPITEEKQIAPPPPISLPEKRLYTAPRPAIPRETVAKEFPEECLKFWNSLRSLDLATHDIQYPKGNECHSLSPEIQKWHEAYEAQCVQNQTPECEQALFSYRAALSEMATANTPLSEIRDPSLLTDKMLMKVLTPSNPEALAAISDRLLELEPKMLHASRASLLSHLQSAEEGTGNPHHPKWKKVEEALDRASQLEEDRVPYLETKLFAENNRYLDPKRLREKASDVSKQNPELGVGPYYEAWAEFQSGNMGRALELMEEARRREPGDSRYASTLEALQKKEASPFRADLSFMIKP